MEKMTFEFNEVMQTAVIKAAGITLQVTETEDQWSRFFVISSTGIRNTFHSDYNFQNYNKETLTDTEIFLFKVAYEFFEMKRTRLEKQTAEIEAKMEEIVE